jgi:hypothetical protein
MVDSGQTAISKSRGIHASPTTFARGMTILADL